MSNSAARRPAGRSGRLTLVLAIACVVTLAVSHSYSQEGALMNTSPPLVQGSRVVMIRDAGYFPVLALLPSGRVVAVLRGGAGHLGLAGRLEAVWSDDGGKTWSPPVVVAKSERDDRNPAVGVTQSGEIVVAYHHQGSYDAEGKWAGAFSDRVDTLLVRSGDRGETWSAPYPLSHSALNGRSPYGKMLTLPGGEMVMNIYGYPHAGEKRRVSYLLRSRDGGLTWGDPSLIAEEFNETSLALLPNGEVLAALRTAMPNPNLWVCRSIDGGRTWSPPVAVTESNEHPADLLVLRDGSVLMVYGRRHEPFGAELMLSTDGGRTWGHKKALADDAVSGDCGYPCSVQLADDTIISAYYAVGPESTTYDPTGSKAVAVVYQPAALLAP